MGSYLKRPIDGIQPFLTFLVCELSEKFGPKNDMQVKGQENLIISSNKCRNFHEKL